MQVRFGLLALALFSGACARSDAAAPRLAGGEPSVESLGARVWQALVVGDTATLRALRLTEHEHNVLVWPEQPAANPEAGFPVDFAWRNIQIRDYAAQQHLLSTFRGSTEEHVDTRCGGTRAYRTYHALTDCRLVLRSPNGTRRLVEAFRHVVVMDGQHKVVRYYGAE